MTTLESLPEISCPNCDRLFDADAHKGRDALVCPECDTLGVVLFA
ncbi:hypothetical protein [Natrinema gari]|nr:hypothetical protein [Natrinema gari]